MQSQHPSGLDRERHERHSNKSDGAAPLCLGLLHITHDRAVTPCCQAPTSEALSFGNINRQPITEIWDGPGLQQFRRQMRAGARDEHCAGCCSREAEGYMSMRQISNAKYADQAEHARARSTSMCVSPTTATSAAESADQHPVRHGTRTPWRWVGCHGVRLREARSRTIRFGPGSNCEIWLRVCRKIPDFLTKTAALDRLRGESWLQVFPELAALADTATASRLHP